jgi:sec-independent protein translocase protein TatA
MPNLRGSELLILALIIVLLFGAKRLPDAARGLGRSLRIFKAETKGLADTSSSDPSRTAGPAVSSGGATIAPASPEATQSQPGEIDQERDPLQHRRD